MSNDWNTPSTNDQSDGWSSPPRSGRLLRDYRQQNQQQLNQYSPAVTPIPQGNPHSPIPPQQNLPVSPIPPSVGFSPQQPVWPASQGYPSPKSRGLIANTRQLMRRLSGKIAAAGYVDQQTLVLRHPNPPPDTEILPPRPKRWKRSRTMRIAMQMRHRRERWQSNRPKGKNIAIGVLIAFLLLLVIVASSSSAYAYAYYQSELPHLQGLASQHVEQTTRIYDRSGVPLYDVYDQGPGGGRRTPIAYTDIPKVMQDAMIAAEDHTFWDNAGVDPQGILRAATGYAQASSVQGGGSTITQQLIKNLTHDSELSLNRKLSEAALAIGLTQQYDKRKILEMYFNVASFGSLDLGVEAAVEEYFHLNRMCDQNFNCTPGITRLDYNPQTKKHDPLLALARASLLAGMPQNPVTYDPTNGPQSKKYALGRQDDVLHEMAGLGMSVDGLGPITAEVIQKAEALAAAMTFTRSQHKITCPHFVNWVITQVETALGGGDPQQGVHAFLTGGFNIRTTIDSRLEDYVERAVQRHLTQPEFQPFLGDVGPLNTMHNVNDSAVVVMNAKNGEVLAMDGSADFASADPRVNGQFNAAMSPRQPGSTFKPIVYTTAFEMGWYPGIVLPDVKTYFPNGQGPIADKNYSPTDYGGGYSNGYTTIRAATANSRNIPAIKALMFAGIDNVANMARRLGISALDQEVADYNKAHGTHDTVGERFGPSLALGTVDIPLIQMVDAYQVFADQGIRIPPQGVLDIWDNYGHRLYHYDPTHPHGVQVVTPQVAYLMTSVLSDEPARYAEFLNDHILSFNDWDPTYQVHQVATKTGTTDDFKDNWTIGYTPDVVVGVWSGNADNSNMINTIGLTGAAPIWHSVMERVSGHCEADMDDIACGNFDFHFTQGRFIQPPGIHQVPATGGVQGSGYEWILDGENPVVPVLTGGSTSGGSNTGKPTTTPTPTH